MAIQEVDPLKYGDALQVYEADAGPKFASIVRRYLTSLDDPDAGNHDQTFTHYLGRLEKAEMARGTVDLHRRAIRAFYRKFGMAPPAARGWEFDSEAESRRPALDAQLVADLIAAAKDGTLTARQTCILALTTIYGMRAEEVSRVQERDLDRVGCRIFVRTAKKGVRRWFWLPEEVQRWLQREWPETNANRVEKAFVSIWGQVLEIPRPPRTGWHAIRRGLVVALKDAGVPEEDRERFMRWKVKGGMVQLYSRPNVLVGAQGEAPARTEGDEGSRAYDEAIWQNHPWLYLWR